MVNTRPFLTVSVPAALMGVSFDHILESRIENIRTILKQLSTRPLLRSGDGVLVPELMSQRSWGVRPLVSTSLVSEVEESN